MSYQSEYSGAQVDEAVGKALNPDAAPTENSTNLVESGGVFAALSNLKIVTTPQSTTITLTASSMACALFVLVNRYGAHKYVGFMMGGQNATNARIVEIYKGTSVSTSIPDGSHFTIEDSDAKNGVAVLYPIYGTWSVSS